jgi:hypothetical protein
MAGSFSATVDDFVKASNERLAAVMKASTSDVIDQAQTPVAKGGKMRVDTGFLRASGQISLNGMPTGPGRGELTEPDSYSWAQDVGVEIKLATAEPGATIFFGWTANYARYRETYDGFLGSAVQNWQKIVDDNVRKLKVSING